MTKPIVPLFYGKIKPYCKLKQVEKINNFKRSLYIIVGLLSFGIGIAGTILPVLPGGPFFLFASYCFTRSSERLNRWYMGTRFYKQYVDRYFIKKYMTRGEKIRINLIADFFIVMSILMIDMLIVRIIMVTLALMKHYYFIFKIRTIKREEINFVLDSPKQPSMK